MGQWDRNSRVPDPAMRCLPDWTSQGISSFGNPYSVSRLSCPKPAGSIPASVRKDTKSIGDCATAQRLPLHDRRMHETFRRFAKWCAETVGSAEVFLGATVLILIWGALGPRFHYSDTWQLIINTATTIITFLMVFIIQNTQSRDAKAIQLKLDELIRAVHGARTGLVRLEELSEEDLAALTCDFEKLRARGVVQVPDANHPDTSRSDATGSAPPHGVGPAA